MFKIRILLFALALLGVTPCLSRRPVPAAELFEDFTPNVAPDWREWALGNNQSETPRTSPNVQIVESPDRPCERAWKLRIERTDWVLQGDQTANKERAELIWRRPNVGRRGSDWWYAWSVFIPTDYDYDSCAYAENDCLTNANHPFSGSTYQIFGQFHSVGVTSGPQPVISLRHDADGVNSSLFIRCGLVEAHTEEMCRRCGGETEQRTSFTITRGTWTDVMLHILWRQGNGKGYVDVYSRTGDALAYIQYPRMNVGTMYNELPNELRLGIYRGGGQPQPNTLYIGRARVAKTRPQLHLP